MEKLPDISEPMFNLYCSELVSKALLRDESIGRYGGTQKEVFVATSLATWLFTWINE
jgi:hypothetical protein